MDTHIMSNEIFTSILFDMGVKISVDKIEIDGLMDTPGHHWSNPGVKQISAYAGGKEYRFVLKILAEHSKREIKAYNYLTAIDNYPIPRLYHSVYDDNKHEYWMIIERCLVRDFPGPEKFWIECGTLLARIHSAYWGKTDSLPPLFYTEPKSSKLRSAVETLSEYLESLPDSDITIIKTELDIPLSDLKACLQTTKKERLLDFSTPDRCLLHGSFHSPEIMWRKTSDGYTPLGVDWEACRIGYPSEDLAFGIQNLLPKGEKVLFDTFINSYINEMAVFEIHPDRDSLLTSVRQEALIKIMDGVIPFLLQTYLKVCEDESYREWCDWLKESLPDTIRYVINLISSGDIYSLEIQ